MVQELCTLKRTSWSPLASHKLPDPKWLESKLREFDVDGETLLMYADDFDWPTFWKVLGIEDPAHQLSIQEAIKQFRETSTLYKSIQEPTTAAIGGPVSKPSPAELDSAVTTTSPTIASNTVAEASPAVFKDAARVSRIRKTVLRRSERLKRRHGNRPRRSERLKRRLGNSTV